MNVSQTKNQNLPDNDLILEMRRKQAERQFQRFENNGSPRKQTDKPNQFIPIPFGLLDNPDFRNNYIGKLGDVVNY